MQRVVITGASRGLGRRLAEFYAARGAQVVGCSRKPVEPVHPNYCHIAADVTDSVAVAMMFSEIKAKWDGLDLLINNAGIASMNHALLTPPGIVENIFKTNVFSLFTFCREATKLMRRNDRGRIVNISSVAVPYNLEGQAAYAASKAAVESLTRTLARELAPFRITVNAVGPTPIDTTLIRGIPKDKLVALIDSQAIKRMGTLEDVANVVDFFASAASDFITGQVVYLGGVS
jgi:3-oxoacyl-[acyl-carrier protein] reductase